MPLLLSCEFISFSLAQQVLCILCTVIEFQEKEIFRRAQWLNPSKAVKRHKGWSTWNVDLWLLNEHSKSESLFKNEVASVIFFPGVVLKTLETGSSKRFCTFLRTELLKPRKGRIYISSSSVSSLIGKWLPGHPVSCYWPSSCRLCLPLKRSI